MRLPGGLPVDVTAPQGWHIHPTTPVVPIVGATVAEMVAVYTIGELGSTTWDGRGRSPMRPLWDVCPVGSPRIPHAIVGAAPSPHDFHLVWADARHQLWSVRRAFPARWGDPARIGGNLLLHPFSQVAATPAVGALHVLAVDNRGLLVHLRWAPPAAWPPATAAAVGGDPVLPAAALGLIAGDATTLVAIGLGTDLRLRRWTLVAADPPRDLERLGGARSSEETLHPATTIGLFRPQPSTVVVTAVAGDGSLRRYTLQATGGWTASAATRLDPVNTFGGIHPLTDLPSLPDGRLLAATVRPGVANAVIIDPRTAAVLPLP